MEDIVQELPPHLQTGAPCLVLNATPLANMFDDPEQRQHNGHRSVQEEEDRDKGEYDEPEPEDEIYFLIDDVLGQYTEPVLHPIPSRRSNIRQVARYFRGEGVTHWVAFSFSLALRHAEILDNLPAVPAELTTEEPVRQVKLDDQEDKVEQLT